MVVPILGRMSDPNDEIRSTATNIFASLVKMVPLEVRLLTIIIVASNETVRSDCLTLLAFLKTFSNAERRNVNSSVNCLMARKSSGMLYLSKSMRNCVNISKMVLIGWLSWPSTSFTAFSVTVCINEPHRDFQPLTSSFVRHGPWQNPTIYMHPRQQTFRAC